MTNDPKPQLEAPTTPAQKFIKKAERLDRIQRGVEVFILFLIVVFNVFIGISIRNLINQNQANVVEARQQNIQRQDDLKGYVKCVILLPFGPHPETLQTKQGASDALDRCAKQHNQ